MSDFTVFEPTADGYRGYEIKGYLCPVVLDPETFMPKRKLRLEVWVPFNDHGGRSMTEAMICLHESDLVDKILSELRPQVLEYVKHINPFMRSSKSE